MKNLNNRIKESIDESVKSNIDKIHPNRFSFRIYINVLKSIKQIADIIRFSFPHRK